jgi:hypothetical protein
MSYCTVTDVQAVNPKRVYDATTTPTLTQLGTFITTIAAEVDTVLQGRGFATPVTAANTTAEFLAFLLALNARGAAAMAEQAMFPESKGMMAVPAAQVLWKQYQEGLKWLKEGPLPAGTVGEALPFSFFEKEGAGEVEPGKDEQAWAKPKFGMNKDF